MKNLDWGKLSFGYSKTDYNVRCYYKDGKWGALEVSDSEILSIHMASTCLHYGQEAFEGMKAFRGQDGKIRLFRCEENAKRMLSSAEYVMMQAPSVELFEEAVVKAVELNKEYVPPYESGASLYIRPLLIGVGPQMGVAPAKEYMFVVFVAPVGPYFKSGFKPTKVMLERHYDRAAPNGTAILKWEVIMPLVCAPGKLLIKKDILRLFFLILKKRSILMSADRLISSALKTVHISLLSLIRFCLLLRMPV